LAKAEFQELFSNWIATMQNLDRHVLIAILVGFVIRVIRLDYAPLWFDETFTAEWVRQSLPQMIHTVLFGNYNADHLPLYFLILKVWTSIVGHSDWTLRFPSVVFSCAAIYCTSRVSALMIGSTAARWVAWLGAISPFLLHHAQEARMYPMLTLLAAYSMLLVARYVTGESKRLGVRFVWINLALLATHYYAVFFVMAQGLFLLLARVHAWRSWLWPTLAVGVAALAQVLWGLMFSGHAAGVPYEMGGLAFPGFVWSLVSGYVLLPTSEALHAQGFRAALLYLPIAVACALPLLYLWVTALRTLPPLTRNFVFILLGGTVLGPFAAYMILGARINPRYASCGVPAMLILLAGGILGRHANRGRWTAVSAVIAIMLSASILHLSNPGHGREDIRSAGQWLTDNVRADEPILVTSTEMKLLAEYHWPDRQFLLYPASKVKIDKTNMNAVIADLSFDSQNRAIYLIGRAWLSDPAGRLPAALRDHYRSCGGAELRGIKLFCLEKSSAVNRASWKPED
jgi:uncharacterized membrane protein